MTTWVRLSNKDGAIIYSNLDKSFEPYFLGCEVQNEILEATEKREKMRHGKIENDFGVAYLITKNPELVSRPRLFKEKVKLYAEHLKEIDQIKDELRKSIQADSIRLIHNITSINGHNIQEVYLLAPEEQLTKDYKSTIETIKEFLKGDLDSAASAILRIAKNSIAMKSEFTVFKKVYSGGTPTLQRQFHDIRKVLLTVFHVFFQDFKERDVHVQIDDCARTVFLDFETIRVALYHFIDNTAKYILPGSQLRIRFSEKPKSFTVIFDMISMEIYPNELKEIVKEGVSGENAKKANKQGDGVGLAIIDHILKLNKATFTILPNSLPAFQRRVNGIPYVRNIFEMTFPAG